MTTENTNPADTARKAIEVEKLLMEMARMQEEKILKRSLLISLAGFLISGLAGLTTVLMFFQHDIHLGSWTLTVAVALGAGVIIALITQLVSTIRASQHQMRSILEAHQILTEMLSADIKAGKGAVDK